MTLDELKQAHDFATKLKELNDLADLYDSDGAVSVRLPHPTEKSKYIAELEDRLNSSEAMSIRFTVAGILRKRASEYAARLRHLGVEVAMPAAPPE